MPPTSVVVFAGPKDGVQLRDRAAVFRDAVAAHPAIRDRVTMGAVVASGDLSALRDVEVIVCGTLTPEALAAAPRLRWVSFWASGLDQKVTPELRARDVVITNAAGIHGPNIAEHVLMYMLIFTRRFPVYDAAQRAHRWVHNEEPTEELTGQTLGIVGLGAVGHALAVRARPFGMRIVATKRDPDANISNVVDALYGPAELPRLLSEADHVAITVPYTRETHHLLDAAMLARMKPGAYLYNTARGTVVEEPALIEGLRSGRIRGAGLDVFEREPLAPDSPLWDMPNVLVTPHVAGFTPYYFTRAAALFADNLERYLSGRPLVNVYDATRGY
jgi:phosphoglycerate dehydrogenase-like enzyme